MSKGFDTFMQNPYWRKIYEEAPGEELKEYYRLRFELSPFITEINDKDEDAEERLEELTLYKSDIRYIRQYAGSGTARSFYDRILMKLTGRYENCGVPASVFQIEEWNPWYKAEQNPL